MTRVVFRVWRGGIIALFPDIPENHGYVLSYESVGQHAPADYEGILRESRDATPKEYERLKVELESEGYQLDITTGGAA